MQLVFRQPDGTFVFNWEEIPDENIRNNYVLKDKIFKELQEQYKEGTFATSRDVFEMNKYVIERIRNYKPSPKEKYNEE
jgi:hypothetical protein